MKSRLSYLLIFTYFAVTVSAEDNLDLILTKLDNTISNSTVYSEQKSSKIEQYKLKIATHKGSDDEKHYLYNRLFDEYKSFVCDSAIHYQNKNIELSIESKNKQWEYSSKIKQAYLMGSSGLYKEAIDLLESIDTLLLPKELAIDYNFTFYEVYKQVAFYTQDKRREAEFWNNSHKYYLKIRDELEYGHPLYFRIKESRLRNAGKYEESLALNSLWLSSVKPQSSDYALITYFRALTYSWQGNNTEKVKKYLALSAISDIECAIKDHASLWMLAQILFDEGDIDRAYRYIRFSWDETTFFNARQRSLQSATILSLIDQTFQAKINVQNIKLRNFLFIMALIAMTLIVTLVIIYSQNKKLLFTKKQLQDANDDLKHLNFEFMKVNEELETLNEALNDTNRELSESNHIKEEYIGQFVSLCSTYINKIDDFRKKVNKEIITGNIEKAKIITQSQDVTSEKFEELYENFDTVFLQLFPNFVEQVNSLLKDDEKFILKKEELLNPELRILALMRLGITDGTKLANFLQYSLTTIYNYRNKTRNRTSLPKDEFDFKILNI